MQDIYIVGVGMTPFGRMPAIEIKTLTRRAGAVKSPDVGGSDVADESGSRTHIELLTAPTGFEVRPPHRERFPSVMVIPHAETSL